MGLGCVQLHIYLAGIVIVLPVIALFVVSLRRKLVVAVPAIIAAGLLVGIWRGTQIHDALQLYNRYMGQKVTLTGTLADDSTYGDKGQRDMRLYNVKLNGRSPPGVVRVTSFALEQPRRGDSVRVTGKLYDGFGNYQAAIYFGDLHITQVNKDIFELARRDFAAGVYSNLSDTQASLGLGILVGIKTQLPDAVNNQLKMLSLTHIVVASGYNLTVLVRVARRLFERRSKFQTAAVGAALMVGFVVITGFSASMGRAALVSGLSLAAWYYGRRIHPIILLLFSAAITAALNPMYVWGDIGWWLSFLAFTGVLVLAPLLQTMFYGKKRPKLIGQLLLETTAAQLLTTPIMLAIFGNLSVLGLFANVLVVPLVPLAMLATAITGSLAVFTPIAAYAALPASWLLGYMLQVISFLASVSWAAVPIKVDWPIMVGLYLACIVCMVAIWRRTKHDFLAISVVE